MVTTRAHRLPGPGQGHEPWTLGNKLDLTTFSLFFPFIDRFPHDFNHVMISFGFPFPINISVLVFIENIKRDNHIFFSLSFSSIILSNIQDHSQFIFSVNIGNADAMYPWRLIVVSPCLIQL